MRGRAIQRAGWLLRLSYAASLSACEPNGGSNITHLGSKQFTESVLLAELARGVLEASGAQVEHRQALGGTRVLWSALRRGDIDVYPDYTGTLRHEILSERARRDTAPTQPASAASLAAELGRQGVLLGPALGFENSYAIGMRGARAQ